MTTPRGAGGKSGGNSARVPVESPDSLRSVSLAKVVDLISEGEIEGLVSGAKSIYLNGTQLQNDDDGGTMNFTGVTYDHREGTQNQTPLTDYRGTESEFAVSTEVKFGVPITRTLTSVVADAARDRKSTRLNSSHSRRSRMPSSA